MNSGLLLLGVLAWVGVVGFSILMATWGEPVLAFFPIAAAVVAAWAIGEYITDVVWKEKNR